MAVVPPVLLSIFSFFITPSASSYLRRSNSVIVLPTEANETAATERIRRFSMYIDSLCETIKAKSKAKSRRTSRVMWTNQKFVNEVHRLTNVEFVCGDRCGGEVDHED